MWLRPKKRSEKRASPIGSVLKKDFLKIYKKVVDHQAKNQPDINTQLLKEFANKLEKSLLTALNAADANNADTVIAFEKEAMAILDEAVEKKK